MVLDQPQQDEIQNMLNQRKRRNRAKTLHTYLTTMHEHTENDETLTPEPNEASTEEEELIMDLTADNESDEDFEPLPSTKNKRPKEEVPNETLPPLKKQRIGPTLIINKPTI